MCGVDIEFLILHSYQRRPGCCGEELNKHRNFLLMEFSNCWVKALFSVFMSSHYTASEVGWTLLSKQGVKEGKTTPQPGSSNKIQKNTLIVLCRIWNWRDWGLFYYMSIFFFKRFPLLALSSSRCIPLHWITLTVCLGEQLWTIFYKQYLSIGIIQESPLFDFHGLSSDCR